jgi:predicted CopG family antitoxin
MMFDDDEEVIFEKDSLGIPESSKLQIPVWVYLALFFVPSSAMLVYLYQFTDLNSTTSAIIALAVMNGSINSVIAWLTIRLDGHSTDALEHLDAIINEMDNLEETLDDANEMVTSFTTDLNDAKRMFEQVGLDLGKVDIDSVSDVINRIKENRGDINIILDNLKEVDVTKHLEQARRIDWQMLMDSAEEIMSFIRTNKDATAPKPAVSNVVLPKLPNSRKEVPIISDDDGDFFEGSVSPIDLLPPRKTSSLDLRPPRRRSR